MPVVCVLHVHLLVFIVLPQHNAQVVLLGIILLQILPQIDVKALALQEHMQMFLLYPVYLVVLLVRLALQLQQLVQLVFFLYISPKINVRAPALMGHIQILLNTNALHAMQVVF